MIYRQIIKIIPLFLLFFFAPVQAIDEQELLPPEKAFQFKATLKNPETLTISWTIADGYYLYRDKIHLNNQSKGIKLSIPQLPKGIIKEDEYFGKIETYRHQIAIDIPISRELATASQLTFETSYQGCADVGVCYPPQKQLVSLSLPPVSQKLVDNGSLFDPIGKLTKSLTRTGLFEDDLLPPDQAFQLDAELKKSKTIHLHWQIADGYYLYRNKLNFNLLDNSNSSLGSFSLPRGEQKEDEYFGQIETYHGELNITLPLIRHSRESHQINLIVEYQGCAEKGVCYPPIKKTIPLLLPIISEQQPLVETTPPGSSSFEPRQSEQDQIASDLEGNSLFLTILSFFGFGLLLSLTPCVFPMIPILSGIIIGHGKEITTRHAFFISVIYVLAVAITYTFFGVLAGLFGSNIQAVFQNPWVLTTFSALFVALSFSMFGFYELQLPSRLQSRLSELSNKQQHTFIGTAIMGVLSALIVGPCIAAPLAGALIYIGQTGDAVLGGLALFSMGIGSGVPLIIIGTSAGKLLPKAGPWMYAIKAFFGVGLLAVAIWLMERILPVEVTMLLWAALFIISSVYMGATDAVNVNQSGWFRLWKGLGQLFLIIGALLIIGAASGGKDLLHPLRTLSDSRSVMPNAGQPAFRTVRSLQALQDQLNIASEQGKWVMLDFYADWCVSCKELDETFIDPAVQKKLSNMLLLRADVTANNEQDSELLQHFGLFGPPAILFFGPDKLEQKSSRIIGYKNAEEFLSHLERLK